MVPVKLGKYRLEQRLASGGMGKVWVAFDEQLQRRVAVKQTLHSNAGDTELRKRFEVEAQLIARLQHPNVVQVYDYGISDDGSSYIVMELLDGEDLATRLQRTRTMTLAAFTPLFVQAAKALAAAHREGIVHRDLKPGNLFLARHGDETAIKILDFGIAATRASPTGTVTVDQRAAGTLHYMSPEQVAGSETDQTSDLWSLAVVAYQVLTGELPFVGADAAAVQHAILEARFIAPSQHNQQLGPEVDSFFQKALARDPQARFTSAMEMATAFSRLDPESNKCTKILVVDDEPDVVTLMRKRFREQIRTGTYEFVFAGNGEEALQKLAEHPDTDIVLTDINMPGMDGLTFLSKASKISTPLKAIVISAYSDMTNIRQAMNRGAFDFLVKPLDFRDLETTIRKAATNVRELRRALRSVEENDALRMFVDNSLLERMLPALRMTHDIGSESVEGTLLCVDICGVRDFSRRSSPDELLKLLNSNFDVIVPAIHSWKGRVVRFVGDSVMAVFQDEAHRERACGAAVFIREKLHTLAASYGPQSAFAHGVSVGIDSGVLISGNIGSVSMRRLDFAVLGDVVSTALCLQQSAGRDQLLISGNLRAQLGDVVEAEKIDLALTVGDHCPEVYSIRRVADEILLRHGPQGPQLTQSTRTGPAAQAASGRVPASQ
jgi:serine/threonine protein kinase